VMANHLRDIAAPHPSQRRRDPLLPVRAAANGRIRGRSDEALGRRVRPPVRWHVGRSGVSEPSGDPRPAQNDRKEKGGRLAPLFCAGRRDRKNFSCAADDVRQRRLEGPGRRAPE
jgi:hypothetical protein